MSNPSVSESQAEYEARERTAFRKQLDDVDRAPLADRQAARQEWAAALVAEPPLIAERVSWLLNGSYGYGSYSAARDVMASPRMNHAAWLGQTIAALEWQCPATFARQAYRTLTVEQRGRVDDCIQRIINRWRKEQADNDAFDAGVRKVLG